MLGVNYAAVSCDVKWTLLKSKQSMRSQSQLHKVSARLGLVWLVSVGLVSFYPKIKISTRHQKPQISARY